MKFVFIITFNEFLILPVSFAVLIMFACESAKIMCAVHTSGEENTIFLQEKKILFYLLLYLFQIQI